jgi:hypothetical protein
MPRPCILASTFIHLKIIVKALLHVCGTLCITEKNPGRAFG